MDTLTTINLGLLVINLCILVVYFFALGSARQSTYIQFYKIIERHHSKEITDLRREVRTEFEREVLAAKQKGIPLSKTNPDIREKASLVANYYESLGMFLQGGWRLFPKSARRTMLEMLHNSTHYLWPLIDKYREEIHPNPPADWAKSFAWLYGKTEKYRNRKRLGLNQNGK